MKALEKIMKISSTAALMTESSLFSVAGEQVEGYMGGHWDSVKISRNYYVPMVPSEGKVRVVSALNYCDVTTDSITAGAALFLVAFNRVICHLHSLNNGKVADLSVLYDRTRDAILYTKALDIPSLLRIII